VGSAASQSSASATTSSRGRPASRRLWSGMSLQSCDQDVDGAGGSSVSMVCPWVMTRRRRLAVRDRKRVELIPHGDRKYTHRWPALGPVDVVGWPSTLMPASRR